MLIRQERERREKENGGLSLIYQPRFAVNNESHAATKQYVSLCMYEANKSEFKNAMVVKTEEDFVLYKLFKGVTNIDQELLLKKLSDTYIIVASEIDKIAFCKKFEKVKSASMIQGCNAIFQY